MANVFLSGKRAITTLILGSGVALLSLAKVTVPDIYKLPVVGLTVGAFVVTYLLLWLSEAATAKMN